MIIRPGTNFDGLYDGSEPEKQFKEYMAQLREYTGREDIVEQNTKLYVREKIPQGFNVNVFSREPGQKFSKSFLKLPPKRRKEILDWAKEQFNRFRDGHDGLTGNNYLYFNWIWHQGNEGVHQTQFRMSDVRLFRVVDSLLNGPNDWHKYEKGTGLTLIGKRRGGKTARIGGGICLHGLLTKQNIEIIGTSKTQEDFEDIVIDGKVKFMHSKLPKPLKQLIYKANNGQLWFGKRNKEKEVAGRNTKISSVSAKIEASEGFTILYMVIDEQGKVKDVDRILKMALPAMSGMDGYHRTGVPMLVGVSGDMDKFPGAQKIWRAHDIYNLVRYFEPMWYGMYVDEYGNEDIERAVMEELMERNKIWKNTEMSDADKEEAIRTRMQQYCLTVEESFLSSDGGKFNNVKLGNQEKSLVEDPVPIAHGDVEWIIPGHKAVFHPKTLGGKVQVLEPPRPGFKYVIGLDSFGLKQGDINTGSSGAMYVWKCENRALPPSRIEQLMDQLVKAKTNAKRLEINLKLGHLPVCFYQDRMHDPAVFADKSCMIAAWYWYGSKVERPVKILPETEPAPILDYILKTHPHLLMNEPLLPGRKVTKEMLKRWGLPKKGEWLDRMLSEISHYINNYCDRIYFMDFLRLARTYDETRGANKKHDNIDAFGNTLIHAGDPRIDIWLNQSVLESRKGKKTASLVNFRRTEEPVRHDGGLIL